MKRFLTLIMLMVFMAPSAMLTAQVADAVADVYARQLGSDEVEVMWSWDEIVPQAIVIDFETGDFSQGNFKNDATFPWEITQDAYEGNYAIKSTNAGNDGTEPLIELTVEVPYDGMVGFYHKVESEWGYDGGLFYIDGNVKGSATGITGWAYHEAAVSAGVHTYSWEYYKDNYGDEGDIGADSYWIDNIVPFYPKAEIGEGWIYYDDGALAQAIGMGTMGADNYWAVSFPDMSEYAGKTLTKIAVYDREAANMTAFICLGGDNTAPGSVASVQEFATTALNDMREVELDTPIAIDGTQPLWIVLYTNEALYPATGALYSGDPNSSWFSMDGSTFVPVESLGVSAYSWMIRGFIEDSEGRTMALSQGSIPTAKNVNATKVKTFAPERKKIVGTPVMKAASRNTECQYSLYRKNVIDNKSELIAENLTDTIYIDNEWATLGYGAYKWGVEVMASRKANRGDIFNVDFENGVIPEGWITKTEQVYPSPSEWSAANGLKYTNFPAIGQYSAFSNGTSDDGLHYNMITSAVDLTSVSAATLSFDYANLEFLGGICVFNVKVGATQDGPWETVFTTGADTGNDWESKTIDLADYIGETIYIAFENEDHDGYGIGVDNIVLSTVEPNIVWSNVIDKDMYTTVSVSMSLNTGENVSGTEVTFVNVNEIGVDYTVKLGSSGEYTWNEFRKGIYEYTVYKRGYESCATNEIIEIADATSLTCELEEIVGDVKDLYVSPTGLAIWEGDAVASKGDEFKFDFEDGTIAGWTTVDADGDGYGWMHMWDFWGVEIGYNSKGCITSASYTNETGALYPDNYIITEEKYLIGDASQLSFMLSVADLVYPNEHYGVAVSTTGKNPADFTMVWEETFMGEKSATREVGATRETRSDEVFTEWFEKTVDLSAYSGQEVYIALRHFDVTDMYIFAIDDIELLNVTRGSRAIESYTVSLNGVVEADNVTKLYYQHENVTVGETYTTTVVANYVSGESVPMEYTWTCVACDEYEGVTDFAATHVNGNAVLSWRLPEGDFKAEELNYDDGSNFNLIGQQGGGNFLWAVMFPAEDMMPGDLTKVMMYDGAAHTGDISIYLGGDAVPGTLVTTQPYECNATGEYVDFKLSEPVTIDGTENLWIVFANNDNSAQVAPASDVETVNGGWISVDGVEWYNATEVLGFPVAWQVRGYIERGADPLGVVIYRDGKLLIEDIISAETYSDPMKEAGTYEYVIKVVYTNYAMSCPQSMEFEYDGVSVNENETTSMMIYPNPVKDNLTIAAEAMTRITITNALGQLMLDETVVSDNEIINMSQYEAGVYVVRIATETGVAVKRITVIK